MKKIKKIDLNQEIDMSKVNEKAKGFWKEFGEFAMRGNVVDLAIGIIIGSAFTSIVNSFVKDIITPLIGAITGGLNYSEWFVALDGVKYATLAEAQAKGAAVLTYGNFITAVINFLIVALVIFIVFKKIFVSHKKVEEAPKAPTEKECPYCKTSININATRCPHCTSELK